MADNKYETEDGNIHMNQAEKPESLKSVEEDMEKYGDVPFPGEGALGPEGI